MSRHGIGLSILAGILLAGCGSHAAPPEAARSAHPSPASTAVLYLQGRVDEMAPAGTDLWFVEYSGPTGVLHRLDTTTLDDTTYPLPGPMQDSGINAHTRIAPDGAVWISDDYRFLRFDPQTHAISVITLSKHPSGEFPDAWTTGGQEGTWISGFTFDRRGNLLVARFNLPFLEIVTAKGAITGRIPLPPGGDGAQDVMPTSTGLTIVAGHHASTLGSAPVPVKVTDPLTTVSGQFLRSDFGGQLDVYFAAGGNVLTLDSLDFTWTRPDGSHVPIHLARRTIVTSDPGTHTEEKVITGDQLTAAIQVGRTLWYVDEEPSTNVLRRLQ